MQYDGWQSLTVKTPVCTAKLGYVWADTQIQTFAEITANTSLTFMLMLLTAEEIVQRLHTHRDRLRQDFKLQRIGLYGSYARNEATTESDIDLVYQPMNGHSVGFCLLLDLEEFLEAVLETENLDLVNLRYMNPIVKLEMIKEVRWVEVCF